MQGIELTIASENQVSATTFNLHFDDKQLKQRRGTQADIQTYKYLQDKNEAYSRHCSSGGNVVLGAK